MRVVYMGSPGFSVPSLEGLAASGYEVVAVYTQPDRPAGRGRELNAPALKEAAQGLGLTVVQTPGFGKAGALEELREYRPDVIVICAFGQVLPQPVLDIPPRQCVNVHFSLLPRHRGASPVAAAILAGDEFTGVSIQLVRQKLDTGPLLASAAAPISGADNTGTLTAKLAITGAPLLLEALSGWTRGEITPRPQDESRATYFAQVKKEDGEIDWRQPAVEIWRKVRAFYPWPGCFTRWKGRRLKIIEAAPVRDISAGAGEVVEIKGDRAAVAIGTGKGALGVVKLQLEGKKAMEAAEFVKGQRDFMGSKLPS